MDFNNGESPATPFVDDCISTHNQEIFYGLTKREAFAMAAMQGLISFNGCMDTDITAKRCVRMADALLKELDK